MSKKQFKGVIKLDVRDSKPDWDPFIPPRAPQGDLPAGALFGLAIRALQAR